MGLEKRKPPLGCHSSFLLIAMLLWPALALGAAASDVFEKVKNAVVVVKSLNLEGREMAQGSGVVLPSGQGLNFAVPVEWVGDLVAQSKKAEPPPAAKTPETAYAPGLSSEPRRAGFNTTWLSQAAALEAARNWSGLLEHSKRWTRAEPGESLAWGALGLAYGRLGRWQDSMEASKEAVRLEPDFAETWNNLGVAYGQLGRWQEAIEACKEAVRLNPDLAEAWGDLGLAYLKLDRWQEAIEACKEAVRLNPDLAEAWGGLVRAYLGSGDRVEALKAVKGLRRLDPAKADELFNQIMGQ